MKKRNAAFLAGAVLLNCTIMGCHIDMHERAAINVPKISVTSESITSDGKLITKTAAEKNANNPKGENKSPHLKWDEVENAACYAVVIFDTSANWLHMFISEINATEIKEGELSDYGYVGTYPPKNSGVHKYSLEVFALREKPDNLIFLIDKKQKYSDIAFALDRKNSQNGNVIAHGSVVGTYTYGDDTK